jgi:Rieske Fe-S protein
VNWPATATEPDPSTAPPATGDRLAFGEWENDGRLLVLDDVKPAAAPLIVYPRDASAGITRERSRLNQILVMKLEPSRLDAATGRRAVDGIVAYSGVCTHAACGVSEWDADKYLCVCPCHGSAFDPAQGARRVNGPAPRALPALPLARVGEHLVVAGPFSARVGATES